MTSLTPVPLGNSADAWGPHSAHLIAIDKETATVSTYEMQLDDLQMRLQFAFRSGQFNMVYLPGIGEAAISISSDPGQESALRHTVRPVGNVTYALARLRVGDQVLLRGPFGSCWPLETCRGHDLVLAAGGLGLAPLRPVIYEIARNRGQYQRVSLLYGARTPSDLLYVKEYDAWKQIGIDVRTTVDFGDAQWTGRIGVVTTLLSGLDLDPLASRIFTCGPEIMMRFVIEEALARGVGREQIFLSIERNMNCAVGLCGHCQLGPTFVCKDGPVFRYDVLEPFLSVEDF